MEDPQVADIFSKCQGKLIGLPRRFDLFTETFEDDPFIQANLNINRNLFIELLSKKRTGFFIHDLRSLLPCDNVALVEQTDPSSPPATVSESERISYGSMFVPNPHFGSIFLFKSISKVTEHTGRSIVESLKNQLQHLNANLESPVRVRLMITFKNDKIRKIFPNIETEVERVCSVEGLTFINMEFKYCTDRKQKVEDFDFEPRPSDGLTKLMKKVFDSDQLTQNCTLSRNIYKHFGGKSFEFTEHEKVISMFNIYFPGFNEKLEMIPDCNRIKDSLLYSTNKEAMFIGDESKYMGEVKWFLDECIPMLEPMTGVLIKNWDHHLFNNLLSSNAHFSQDFEFDYLLCNKNSLVVFEVAATQKTESPEVTVMNKLDQSITKILPTLRILTARVLENVPDIWFIPPEYKQINVQRVIRDNLKVIVYLPNATIRGFKSVIKHNKDIRQFIAKFKSPIEKTESLNQIYFVMHKHEKAGKKLMAIRLDSNLEMEEIGEPRLVVDNGPERSENLKLYLFALIAFSKLKCDNAIPQPETSALDVDERYKESGSNPNLLDIILSPKQEFILNSEPHPRVWLRGEPGSGKTALLLAKAIQLAEKPEIKRVFYAIPSEMYLLRSFIEKEVDKYQNNVEFANKIQIVSFDDYDHLHRQVQDLYRSDSCQLPYCEENASGSKKSVKRKTKKLLQARQSGNLKNRTQLQVETVALFIDEVYVNMETEEEINKFDQLEVKAVWIAEVVRNNIQINWAKKFISFKVINLTVLYRNSHHISQTASSLVNSSGVTESTAVVHGCHTSSQKEIALDFYSNEEQLSQVTRDQLDSRFEDGRLFIYFTSSDGSKSPSAEFRRLKLDYGKDDFVFIGSEIKDKLPFAGCEKKSVVLVIDKHCEGISGEVIVLSITRAQYEVVVLINDQFLQIDNLLRHLRSVMPPYLRIYVKLKSCSKFTLPEPLATKDVGEVVTKLLDRLTKDEWLKFIRSMPRDRSEDDGVIFADKEDIIVEIVKEPRSTGELLESIVEQMTSSDQENDINEIRRLCKMPTLNLRASSSKPHDDSRGGDLPKVTQAVWRRYEDDIIKCLNCFETNKVMTALEIMKRYEVLQEHLERPDNLFLKLSKSGKASTMKRALEVLAKETLLQEQVERGRLFSYMICCGESSNVKAALQVLAEYNLLETFLEDRGDFFPENIRGGYADSVMAVVKFLAEKNILKEHIVGGGRFFSSMIWCGEASNVKAALQVLAEYNLLENFLEDQGEFFPEKIWGAYSDNVMIVLEFLAENFCLKEHIVRKGQFFYSIIWCGEANIVRAALQVLAEYNLLQTFLDYRGGFFPENFRGGWANSVKVVLEFLAEKNLLKEHILEGGQFFSSLIWWGNAIHVKAALQVLADYNLIQTFIEDPGQFFSEKIRCGYADTFMKILQFLAEKNLLKEHILEGGQFFSSLIWWGKAIHVKAALQVLVEYNLLQTFLEGKGGFVPEKIRGGYADSVMAVLEFLAEENLLEEHILRRGNFVSSLIWCGEASNVKAALEFLAEKNLLEQHSGKEEGFFSDILRYGNATNFKILLGVLEKYQILQKYLQCGSYSTSHTLLTLVCWNHPNKVQTVENAKVLFDKGFPTQLLLNKSKTGENALHIAIEKRNYALVKLLLDNRERRKVFLSEEARYNGKLNALDFAQERYHSQSTRDPDESEQNIFDYLQNMIQTTSL